MKTHPFSTLRKKLLSGLAALITAAPTLADISVYSPPRGVDASLVSVESVQRGLGNDPEAIFAYVRDKVRFTPYLGVMQGARGALLTQSGNAADKALLLAGLLQKAGRQTRFVKGTLDDTAADALMKAALAVPAPRDEGTPLDPRLTALCTEVTQQVEEVLAALKAGGQDRLPFKAQSDLTARVLAGLKDHWWIQLRQGNVWIDLDPSFPDARVGQAKGRAAGPVEAIPESLHQTVLLTLHVEEEIEGRRAQRVVLTRKFRTADLMGQKVFLTHQPDGWKGPTEADTLASATVDALAGSDPDKCIPVLTLGERDWKGEGFYPEGSKGNARGFEVLITALTPKSFALAEWMELEFSSPLGLEKSRYEFFDRAGFAVRRAGGGEVSREPLGLAHPAQTMLALSFSAGPITNQAAFVRKPASTVTHPGRANDAYVDISGAMGEVLDGVAGLADRLVLPLEGGEHGRVVFSPLSPRLTILESRSAGDRATLAIDLRHSRVLPVADKARLADNRFLLQVIKGVVDGAAESLVMDILLAPPQEGSSAPRTTSAARLFQEARRQRIKTGFLTKQNGRNPPAGLTKEAAARISADLDAGQWVVMPDQPVAHRGGKRTAWWRIDPATGETVGVTENGLHGAFDEYKVFIDRTTLATRGILRKRAGSGLWKWLDQAEWAWVLANKTFLKDMGVLTVVYSSL